MKKKLNETQRILQYTFFQGIPDNQYSPPDNYSTLQQIAEGAFSACKQFLADGSPTLMGSNEASNQKTSLFHSFEFTARWKKILMEDAIVKCYITARDFIADNCIGSSDGSINGSDSDGSNEGNSTDNKKDVGDSNYYSSMIHMPTAMRCAYDWSTEDQRIQGLEYLLERGEVKVDDSCTFQIHEIARYEDDIEKKINRDNSGFGKKLKSINDSLEGRCNQHLEILKCEPVPRTAEKRSCIVTL